MAEIGQLGNNRINWVMNWVITKCHKMALTGALKDQTGRAEFREELAAIQVVLQNYTKALADIAQVEDLTAIAFRKASAKSQAQFLMPKFASQPTTAPIPRRAPGIRARHHAEG